MGRAGLDGNRTSGALLISRFTGEREVHMVYGGSRGSGAGSLLITVGKIIGLANFNGTSDPDIAFRGRVIFRRPVACK